MKTSQEKMEVANTILAQLGGRKFIVMTGAKNFLALDSGLSFKCKCPENKASHVRITLTPEDTYTVEFLKIQNATMRSAGGIKTISTHEDIYCDMLQDLFTSETGLLTSMGTMSNA